jgi:hypothetical protein
MELIKQFKEHNTPQSYVKVEGTIDDVALKQVRSGEQISYMIDRSGRQSKLYYIIKKAMINPLGMTDWVTYLLMYSKRWYRGWAKDDKLDIKKYQGREGILFRAPDKVFKFNPFMTALVVITSEPQLEIRYCKLADINKELTKNVDNYRYFKDGDVFKSGAPKSIFSEKDVF